VTHCIVTVDRTAAGQRWFFVCDCCGQLRDGLIWDDGRSVCRTTYVEQGRTGTRAIRRARVTLALADLAERRPMAQRQQLTLAPAVAPKAARPAHSRPQQISDWYSTRRALLLGRGAGDYDLVRAAVSSDSEAWHGCDPVGSYHRPHETALIGQVPELDLRVLAPSLLNSPGRLIARTLCWRDRSGPHHEILFVVDWRKERPQLIAGHDFTAETARWQPLPLLRQANGRFRFVCPVMRTNYDILYLRGGAFASRQARRMVHCSQRAAGKRVGKLHKLQSR